MKKVQFAQETKKLNKYEELKGVSIVMQPVDILLTTEKSKELIENGVVLLENYKGRDVVVTYKNGVLKAYNVNTANGFVIDNGKVYQVEIVDNSQEIE